MAGIGAECNPEDMLPLAEHFVIGDKPDKLCGKFWR
jgi:hypothetical protein